MNRLRKALALSLFGSVSGLPVEAATITRFRAPPNIYLPDDGAWYTFQATTVEVTTQMGDVGGGFIPLVYRDWLLATHAPIDGVNLRVPPGLLANTKLTFNIPLTVGCDPTPFVGINGPAGATDIHPADIAEFVFPSMGNRGFGGLGPPAHSIHCLEADENGNFPAPSADPPQDMIPTEDYPYPPEGGLVPQDYLSFPNGYEPVIVDPVPVPEPSSLAFLMVGGCGAFRRMK